LNNPYQTQQLKAKKISKKTVFGLVFVLPAKTNTMNRKNKQPQGNMPGNKRSNTIKDPNDWKTGDEEMTGAQRSYLHTLADEAGEDAQDDLTKAEAAKKIEALQDKTGRGK